MNCSETNKVRGLKKQNTKKENKETKRKKQNEKQRGNLPIGRFIFPLFCLFSGYATNEMENVFITFYFLNEMEKFTRTKNGRKKKRKFRKKQKQKRINTKKKDGGKRWRI
jgi:hypothetical protein